MRMRTNTFKITFHVHIQSIIISWEVLDPWNACGRLVTHAADVPKHAACGLPAHTHIH